MNGYRIAFSHPFPGGSETTRIRNWAVDLARELRRGQLGEVPGMDSATTEVTVYVFKNSYLAGALRAIRSTLRKANLSEQATVTRANP